MPLYENEKLQAYVTFGRDIIFYPDIDRTREDQIFMMEKVRDELMNGSGTQPELHVKKPAKFKLQD